MKTKITMWAALVFFLGMSSQVMAQFASVQIIHNSPDAAAATVDIYANGIELLGDVPFRGASPFVPVPAGMNINIAIAPGDSESVADAVAGFDVMFDADETYIVMATGIVIAEGYNPAPAFNLEVFAMGREEASMMTNTDLLVYHGSTDAPVVDVAEIGVGAGTIVDDIAYGEFTTDYLELANADYVLEVLLDDGTPTGLQYDAPLETLGLAGGAGVVFASGFLDPSVNNDGEAFGLWVALPDGSTLPLPVVVPPATANLQVIHNAADLALATVDVYVNDVLTLDDFNFRDATSFLEVPAGVELSIGFAGGASASADDILTSVEVTLMDGENYIAIANGMLSTDGYMPLQPFGVDVFAGARTEATNAANTDVLVYHGSTDAPVVDVAEILLANATIVDDIAYSEFTDAYLELATADYALQVQLADGTSTGLEYSAPLATLGLDGGSALVFASGFLDPTMNSDGAGFGLWAALADGTTIPLPIYEAPEPTALLQVIHNAADLALATVDIYVNDVLTLDDFNFRDATSFLEVPAGVELSIGFAGGASTSADDILTSVEVTLMENTNYVAIANGMLSTEGYDPLQPFGVDIFVGGRTEASNAANTDVLIYHGSTDAPTVDINEVGVGVGPLVDNISYGEFILGYAELPNDNYYLQVRLEDGVTPVVTYVAPLEDAALAGGAGVAFASGFLNPANNSDGPAFGLFVALADGTVIELPALGAAPANNLCDDAEALTVGQLGTCGENTATGDLTNAWNSTLVADIPACELAGIITDTYYSFNTSDFNQLSITLTSLVSDATEVGYELYTACGTPFDIAGGCVFNASLQGTLVYDEIPLNTDMVIRIFTNQDFGSESGAYTLCIEGDFVDSVGEENSDAAISVYPNPNNGNFFIQLGDNESAATVVLTDLAGRLVFEGQIEANNGTINVNLDSVEAGFYNVSVRSNGQLLGSQQLVIR